MTGGKLTGMQKAFCREYAIDFNGSRAAIAAGYGAKGARVAASRMLTMPNINAEVDRLIDESLGTSRNRLKKQVLTLTKEIAEKTKETTDENGQPITDYKSADRDRLKALEMLGKYAGVFVEQGPVVEITNKYSIMTDEEIDKRLAELRDEIDKKR